MNLIWIEFVDLYWLKYCMIDTIMEIIIMLMIIIMLFFRVLVTYLKCKW